jgi:hypothetical protein
MTVAGLTLSRTNWREYAYATDAIRRERANLAFSNSPALAMFASETLTDDPNDYGMRGMGRVVQTGAPAILRFVTLGEHAGAAAVSGPFGQHNVDPDENDRPSEVNWKFYNHGLAVSEHDLRVNRGDTAIANFLDRQTSNVLMALGNFLATDIYATAVGANNINSLPALLNFNDSVQGISGQTFLPWNIRGLSVLGTAPASISMTAGSFAASGLTNMRRLVNNAEEGMIRPNVILTEYATIERYEASLQPQERFQGAVKVADGSFPSLAFRTIPVIPDRKCTSGNVFALRVGDRTHGIEMDFLAGATFTFNDWKPSQTQNAMVRPLEATCNLSIGNRQFGSNRMTGVTD